MAENILIFFGKNTNAKPIWTEPYSPDKTIGNLINNLIINNSDIIPVDRAVVIFKFKNGDTTNYDRNDQFWNRDTKISEYLAYSGLEGNNVRLIYYIL